MNRVIILDCQTPGASFNCEDCIAYKECTVRKKLKEEKLNLAQAI